MNPVMRNFNSPLMLGLMLLSSAVVLGQEPKVMVDYHTTVERLFNLKEGMSLSEVNQALGSEPYNLLQNTADGYMMLEYRYVKAHRTVKSSEVDTESGRIIGAPHYKDASSVYLMFDNNHRLVNYVTADALGEVEHQYKLEATARSLGARDAPCTRNCRIAVPGMEVVEAGDAEPEAAPVVVEEEPVTTGLGSLFTSVRERVAATVSEPDPAPSPNHDFVEGDRVWVTTPEGRSAGVIASVSQTGMVAVRYTHPVEGSQVTKRMAPSNLEHRE